MMETQPQIEVGDHVTVVKGPDRSYQGDVFVVANVCGAFVVLHGVVSKWGTANTSRLALDLKTYQFQHVDQKFIDALRGEQTA